LAKASHEATTGATPEQQELQIGGVARLTRVANSEREAGRVRCSNLCIKSEAEVTRMICLRVRLILR